MPQAQHLRFLKTNVLVLVFSNLSNVFQYLTHVVMGRAMSPADFGVFNSVYSLVSLVASISTIISYTAARRVVLLRNSGRSCGPFVRRFLGWSAILGLSVTALAALFSPMLTGYLGLQSSLPVHLFLGMLFLLLASAPLGGFLQGYTQYVVMNFLQALLSPLRLGLVVVLVWWLGYAYNGALVASLLSYLLVGGIHVYVVRRVVKGDAPSQAAQAGPHAAAPADGLRPLLMEALPIAGLWLVVSVLTNIDIPLVKHFCSESDAGMYSAAAIIGRIAFYLPAPLLSILFPEVVRGYAEGKGAVRSLLAILAVSVVVAGTFAALCSFFPRLIVSVLFGGKYVGADPILRIIACSMALAAVANILLNFYIASGLYFILAPGVAAIGGILAGVSLLFHDSPEQIAWTFLAGLLLLTLYGLLDLVIRFRKDLRELFRPNQAGA